MVPVRSEPTQPELPSVSPIRLLPWETKGSEDIGPAGGGRVPRHDRVADGHRARSCLYMPPPYCGGVAADGAVGQRGRAVPVVVQAAADLAAELPLTVQLVSVAVPAVVAQAAAVVARRSCR